MVLAMIRAQVVLPTPRGPQNRKACAKVLLVFQGVGDGALAHDGVEGDGPVFSSGYDEIFHIGMPMF